MNLRDGANVHPAEHRIADASFSTYNYIQGSQTNYTNHIARLEAFDWLREGIVPGALYDSDYSPSPCTPGTRVEIIGHISDWVHNPNGRGLCWLSGHVGTGKSAIAKTISQLCKQEGRLAATFFCSRTVTDRSDGKKLISTIAYQLTTSFPSLKGPIRDAIEANPVIFSEPLSNQFQTMIVGPIIRSSSALPRMVVVIDALDECSAESATTIALLISNTAETYDLPLQFLITSRPESHLHLSFKRNRSTVKSFRLRDFDAHNDIRLFLAYRFENIYEDHPDAMLEVAKPWPSDDQLVRLMDMSRDLFIFAASVARYVDEPGTSPDHRLRTILSANKSSQSAYSGLDSLYRQSLDQCPDKETLRLILGTIVVLYKPLPLPVIWILLRSQIPIGHLRAMLRLLGSVLLFPEDEQEPITTYHKSFRDFLTDKTRSGEQYFVDPHVYGARLTNSCLDLLNDPDSLELPSSMNPSFQRIALDYARIHYLSVLKEGTSPNNAFDFAQFIVYNATILVAYTYIEGQLRDIAEAAVDIVHAPALVIYTVSISFVVGMIPSVYSEEAGYSLLISMLVSGFCAAEGGIRCAAPPKCTIPAMCKGRTMRMLYFIIHQTTTGEVYDMLIRTIFGVGGGLSCTASARGTRSVIRTVTSGVIMDLVTVAIIWIFAVVLKREEYRPQFPATPIGMMGSAVGRAIGAASLVSTGISAAFYRVTLALAWMSIFFHFEGVHWQFVRFLLWIHKGLTKVPVADADNYLRFFVHQHGCRCLKARYYYELQMHEMSSSLTASLIYPKLVAEYYINTLKPTHVSAKTLQEQLYCDWCG